jgi:diaminopimelate epimerase
VLEFDFVKSHGLGNDYLVVDPGRLGFDLTPDRVRQICNRYTGVGSDGILAVAAAAGADFAVRIFNPDGSEAEKSGNGLRIFAKFLHDHGYTRALEFSIHTPGGIVRAHLILEGGLVTAARVEMGHATIDRQRTSLDLNGTNLPVVSVSVGNPHCVAILADLASVDFLRLGPLIERHPAFPGRTNVQFAQVLSRQAVEARIWERGAGHTLASGSSACAVAAACYDAGLVDSPVTIQMEGGDLVVALDAELNLVLTGPVEETCAGRFSADLIRRLQRSPG